jgi:hypothetical protein
MTDVHHAFGLDRVAHTARFSLSFHETTGGLEKSLRIAPRSVVSVGSTVEERIQCRLDRLTSRGVTQEKFPVRAGLRLTRTRPRRATVGSKRPYGPRLRA